MPVSAARRPRSAGAPDKRDALLRAAIDTFAARGFFNAQVADIARTAGVAAGTVYLYFQGKDDLLVSIFERAMTEAIAEGRAIVSRLPDATAQLREIARLHLDRLGRDRALAIVFQVELRQSTKFMERFSVTQLREYLGIIRDVIAHGQRTGTFRTGVNPTLAAKLLFGMLDEMATNWILSRRKYSLVAEADTIVDLFVGGLSANGSPEPARGDGVKRRVSGAADPSTSSGSSRAASRGEGERATALSHRERDGASGTRLGVGPQGQLKDVGPREH